MIIASAAAKPLNPNKAVTAVVIIVADLCHTVDCCIVRIVPSSEIYIPVGHHRLQNKHQLYEFLHKCEIILQYLCLCLLGDSQR